ncbi:MAG: CopG family ribbon-helix-helix protein [Rhizobiaceae bacterium]|nr:CopG family ribbon-helix-helix protein [Rhizobiaceae bacterium]
MAASETFSVRLSPETKKELEDYARATQRSSAFVVKEAIEAHLAERRAYLAAIEEGLRDIERGDVVPLEDVVEWMQSWGKPDELPAPGVRKSNAA